MTKPKPVACWYINSDNVCEKMIPGWHWDMVQHGYQPLYTAAALANVRRAALEQAAKIAVRLASANQSKCCEMRSLRIAEAIRALKEKI